MTPGPFPDSDGRSLRSPPRSGRGTGPPTRRDPEADPDPDGVALAAATTAGVVLGARFPVPAAWVAAAVGLAAVCLRPGRRSGGRPVAGSGRSGGAHHGGAGNGPVAGALVLTTLMVAGAAVASVRAVAVRGGVLVGLAGQPGRVEVAGVVAEEPRRVRYGGTWVVLTVDQVRVDGRTRRTRERAGVVLSGGGADGRFGVGTRLAVGDRVRVRGSVAAARWGDALGRQPPVVLRHPVVEERGPPHGALAGAALGGSEAVREAARRRALATLAPERAGLLVGMALGDTSLLRPTWRGISAPPGSPI